MCRDVNVMCRDVHVMCCDVHVYVICRDVYVMCRDMHVMGMCLWCDVHVMCMWCAVICMCMWWACDMHAMCRDMHVHVMCMCMCMCMCMWCACACACACDVHVHVMCICDVMCRAVYVMCPDVHVMWCVCNVMSMCMWCTMMCMCMGCASARYVPWCARAVPWCAVMCLWCAYDAWCVNAMQCMLLSSTCASSDDWWERLTIKASPVYLPPSEPSSLCSSEATPRTKSTVFAKVDKSEDSIPRVFCLEQNREEPCMCSEYAMHHAWSHGGYTAITEESCNVALVLFMLQYTRWHHWTCFHTHSIN